MKNQLPFDEREVMKSIFQGESGGVPGPLDELTRRRRIDTILALSATDVELLDSPESTLRIRIHALRWIAVAAAVLLVSTTIFVFSRSNIAEVKNASVWSAGSRMTAHAAPSPPAISGSPASSLSVASHIDRYNAMRQISPGVQTFVNSQTEFEVDSSLQAVDIHLNQGEMWLNVDPAIKPEGISVTVHTARGDATVMGTVFGVHEASEYTDVSVLEGKVSVTRSNQPAVYVETGHRYRMGDSQINGLSANEVDNTWKWLADQGMQRRYRSSRQKDSIARTGQSQITAQNLLKAARQYQNAGLYEAANSTLEKLIRQFPTGDEAPVAMVSNAQLLLDRLNRPGAALKQFDTYLNHSRHRGLIAEAMYGRARALKALGDKSAACDAFQAFVAQYPNELLATMAVAQLQQLRTVREGQWVCP